MAERSGVVCIETSAVLRAVLEGGVDAEAEAQLAGARALVTSRLTLVEAARALHRLRREGSVAEAALADAARELDRLWSRCNVWEITASICDLAAAVAPAHPLRTLDAIHLATFLTARRRLGDVTLLTADRRLRDAAGAA